MSACGGGYQVSRTYCQVSFIPLFIFLSLQFSDIKIFRHSYLRNSEAYKVDTWYTHGQWVDILCIPQSGCCFLFVPYFFLSNVQKFKNFVTLFSGTVRPRKFKLGTFVDNGWIYRVFQNQAAAAYLSLYFFIFLSLQLSNINSFVTLFSGTVRPRKFKLDTYVDNGCMYRVYRN